MHRTCAVCALLAVWALASDRALLYAQESYAPGPFQLAPTIDLGLQPVEVNIPDPFDLPPLTLNLPPGFSVSVFALPQDGHRPVRP